MRDMTEVKGRNGFADEAAVRTLYKKLTLQMIECKITAAAMESCTSGQVASLITDTEGSSAVFKGAFVSYSNEAKIMMGVDREIIEQYGVYSPETAASMAQVCRSFFGVCIGIGVTGSFGNPDPNNAGSVPGEVFFAISGADRTKCCHCRIPSQLSRYGYKMYMAEVIGNELETVLKLWFPAGGPDTGTVI